MDEEGYLLHLILVLCQYHWWAGKGLHLHVQCAVDVRLSSDAFIFSPPARNPILFLSSRLGTRVNLNLRRVKGQSLPAAYVRLAIEYDMVNPEGLEPPTYWLKASSSTVELRVHDQCSEAHWEALGRWRLNALHLNAPDQTLLPSWRIWWDSNPRRLSPGD